MSQEEKLKHIFRYAKSFAELCCMVPVSEEVQTEVALAIHKESVKIMVEMRPFEYCYDCGDFVEDGCDHGDCKNLLKKEC